MRTGAGASSCDGKSATVTYFFDGRPSAIPNGTATSHWDGNALVTDKWFSLQAGSLHPKVLEHVKALAGEPDFTLSNPNRVRALYMSCAVNPKAFHAASGEDLKAVYDVLSRQLVVELREMEITSFFAALSAALMLMAAGLSLAWYHRIF